MNSLAVTDDQYRPNYSHNVDSNGITNNIIINDKSSCQHPRKRRRRDRHSIGFDKNKLGSVVAVEYDQWYDESLDFLSSGDCIQSIDDNNTSIPSITSVSKTSGCISASLPTLLYEREVYGIHSLCRRHCRSTIGISWMKRILFDSNTSFGNKSNKRNSTQFRLYCQRALKFSDLCHNDESNMDAVIGIAPTSGCYVIGFGNTNNQYTHLQFCGLPSCSKNTRPLAQPLLLSIPLRESIKDDETTNTQSFLFQSSPVLCPIRVWLSTDERIGLCMYRTSIRSLQMNLHSTTANVVLFPLPSTISRQNYNGLVLFHQLSHIHVPCQQKQDFSSFDDCNQLVHVPFFPNRRTSPLSTTVMEGKCSRCNFGICDTITKGIASYLFLIDEDDGFRLTWVHESSWNTSGNTLEMESMLPLWERRDTDENETNNNSNSSSSKSVVVYATIESRIVMEVSYADAGWEPMIASLDKDQSNSTLNDLGISEQMHLEIAFTGNLSIAALLLDILARRPRLVSPRFRANALALPNFTYQLIQVKNGRIVELLLIFSVGPIGRGCIGVYLEVDLFTQDYRELEWIRQEAHDTPPLTCSKMVFDRHRSQSMSNADQTMTDDWSIFFPDCVSMDNRAIRRGTSALCLTARSSPVTISFM